MRRQRAHLRLVIAPTAAATAAEAQRESPNRAQLERLGQGARFALFSPGPWSRPFVSLWRWLTWRPAQAHLACGPCFHFTLKSNRWGHCRLRGDWTRDDLGCADWTAPLYIDARPI